MDSNGRNMDEKKIRHSAELPASEAQSVEVNETGHIQELERNFSLLSICSVSIVTDNAWAALGGSIAVAIYNRGPTGVIYELIVMSFFFCLIAASLAELASSVPSSSGVYHWASITPGPKYGRICGWFAGWLNFFAWSLQNASAANINGTICVGMWKVYHPDYELQRWHVYVCYVIVTWLSCGTVLFANRLLPTINNFGLFFIVGGFFVSVLVCAIMPSTHGGNWAPSSFVFADFINQTGYSSNGFVFLLGGLNAAYAVGVPDCVTHLAEEIPQPKRNIPLAIGAQMIFGPITTLCYLISICYAITDLDAVLSDDVFPLAQIYAQATQSRGATTGLLLCVLLPLFCALTGSYITSGRTLWTLARDDATPFSGTLGRISPRWKNPFYATLVCGIWSTCLGAINIGSSTAFNAFVGSAMILTTISYLLAILPFLLTGRFSRSKIEGGNGMVPGPFQMPHWLGVGVNSVACAFIMVFVVIFCFPYSMPVTVVSMNYSCVIFGATTAFATIWWLFRRQTYRGPGQLAVERMRAANGTGDEKHG